MQQLDIRVMGSSRKKHKRAGDSKNRQLISTQKEYYIAKKARFYPMEVIGRDPM